LKRYSKDSVKKLQQLKKGLAVCPKKKIFLRIACTSNLFMYNNEKYDPNSVKKYENIVEGAEKHHIFLPALYSNIIFSYSLMKDEKLFNKSFLMK